MSWDLEPEIAFLGAGGSNPRVVILNLASCDLKKLVELPKYHSVYAMDINSDKGTIAIGTRGGRIYLVDIKNGLPEEQSPVEKWIQGAPLLWVRWINESSLVASDTARRCFLWHVQQQMPYCTLETLGTMVCSLINMSDGLLAGLSSEGNLLFWDCNSGKLIRTLAVSAPPPILALVSLIYWPVEKSLVFPSSGGWLALYNLEKEKISYLNAHGADFYAVLAMGETLITAGLKDKRIKIWPPGTYKPSMEFDVPDGVISAGLASDSPEQIVLVGSQGAACTYSLEGNKFEPVYQSGKADYRVVVTHCAEIIKAFRDRQKSIEVRQILTEIQQSSGRLPTEDVKRHHSRLVELGYDHLSLALKASEAEHRDDLIEGLRIYSSLMRILPMDNPSSCPSMERYASLLVRMWQIPEADRIHKLIINIDPSYVLTSKPNDFEKMVGLTKSSSIIEADVAIDHIIRAASAIGSCYYGRYLIRALDPMTCRRVKIIPEMIAEKYETIRKEDGNNGLPAASTDKVWWISRTEIKQINMVILGNENVHGNKGLRFALQVFCDDIDTTVVPVVLFDWCDIQSPRSFVENNETAARMIDDITQNVSSKSYLIVVHKILLQALQRLINKGMAERRIK